MSVVRLSRADGALLAFALFFLPCYLHSKDAWQSALIAAPIFLMTLCTFILNSINDVERDRINHPHRPIPNGSITLAAATIIYFVLFLMTVSLIWTGISPQFHYYYLGAFILAINYNTVVNNLPAAKNIYGAAGHALPVLLANAVCGGEAVPVLLAPSVFFFTLGREVLMDLRDIRGDGPTLVKSVPRRVVMTAAFASQAAGILFLGACVTNGPEAMAFAFIGITFTALAVAGFRSVSISTIVALMRVQFVLGLVFLF